MNALTRLPVVPMSTVQAEQVCASLPIPVIAGVDNGCAVHLYPGRPVTTAEEVSVLAAFRDLTDSRLIWHPFAEGDTVWSRT